VKRRGRSVRELAQRWRVPETVAVGFLWHFRDLGLAVESRGLWYATRKAQSRYRWLVGLGDDA
jgi:hypothetical protein